MIARSHCSSVIFFVAFFPIGDSTLVANVIPLGAPAGSPNFRVSSSNRAFAVLLRNAVGIAESRSNRVRPNSLVSKRGLRS